MKQALKKVLGVAVASIFAACPVLIPIVLVPVGIYFLISFIQLRREA